MNMHHLTLETNILTFLELLNSPTHPDLGHDVLHQSANYCFQPNQPTILSVPVPIPLSRPPAMHKILVVWMLYTF